VQGLANSLGWLVNGNGGTTGKCLGSDGTAYDTPINCITSASLSYQTIQNHGTPLTQRPVLNLVAPLIAQDNAGAGRTEITFNATGNGPTIVTGNGTPPGTTTNLAAFDGAGNIIPSSVSSSSVTVTESFSVAGCTTAGSTDAACQGTITLPAAMADTNYTPALTVFPTAFVGGGSAGPFLAIEVTGALTTTTIPYNITCTFGCGISTANMIYVIARHN
jgi:hypothetical protein